MCLASGGVLGDAATRYGHQVLDAALIWKGHIGFGAADSEMRDLVVNEGNPVVNEGNRERRSVVSDTGEPGG